MKTKYFFLAAIGALTLASCSNDELVGDTSTALGQEGDGSIQFTYTMPNATRADIYGNAAADLLGNIFYVEGTKGTEQPNSPSTTVVFDNYLVHYGANTAGKTESNTANWEYVGITPGTDVYADWVKLGTYASQTIKYWDYSADQYDFLAFSTGKNFKAVAGTSTAANEIGVTKIATGTTLASSAYTFDVPSVDALAATYITDIKEVLKANYGKEVTLQFKNIGSKVRLALYETVPGYAVRDVKFYSWDGTTDFTPGTGQSKNETATLISGNIYGFPTKGQITVCFPHIGVNNSPDAVAPNTSKTDYNKASATMSTATSATTKKWWVFGSLSNFATTKEGNEPDNNGKTGSEKVDYHYIGRTLPTATYAGLEAARYYETVFPVSSPDPITLRVDYTLVSTDGSNEEIKVYGAKAVVPSAYTKWLPNYAYTYIFKISDNTNGWTDTDHTKAGLFPITFDAVVTEATDATGEQTTITTVASPSITTYQQNHNPLKPENEYEISTGKNIYVQLMKEGLIVSNLSNKSGGKFIKSFLYKVSDPEATEAMVVDALEKRVAAIGDPEANVTGRNNITLTWTAIDNEATSIVNGVDDNPISVTTAGKLAEIDITSVSAGTYAYVYDYTTSTKVETTIYQPIIKVAGQAIGETDKTRYCLIPKTNVSDHDTGVSTDPDHYSTAGAPVKDNLYFSITENGTGSKTYSFVSVEGKETIPAGLLKVPVSKLTKDVDGSTVASDLNFYFETYVKNDGLYAVKIIKIKD